MGKIDTALSTSHIRDSASCRPRRRSGCRHLSGRIHHILSKIERYRGTGKASGLVGYHCAPEDLATISQAHRQPGLDVNADESVYEVAAIPDEAPLPDEQLLILEEQHRVRVALSFLDQRCRTLLQMLFY